MNPKLQRRILPLVLLICIMIACAISGCAKNAGNSMTGVVIEIPTELLMERPFDPEKFLSGIKILPETKTLGGEELLHLSSILQQVVALAEAEGQKQISLSKRTNLFRILDGSLREQAQWQNLVAADRISLEAIIGLIEATQRK